MGVPAGGAADPDGAAADGGAEADARAGPGRVHGADAGATGRRGDGGAGAADRSAARRTARRAGGQARRGRRRSAPCTARATRHLKRGRARARALGRSRDSVAELRVRARSSSSATRSCGRMTAGVTGTSSPISFATTGWSPTTQAAAVGRAGADRTMRKPTQAILLALAEAAGGEAVALAVGHGYDLEARVAEDRPDLASGVLSIQPTVGDHASPERAATSPGDGRPRSRRASASPHDLRALTPRTRPTSASRSARPPRGATTIGAEKRVYEAGRATRGCGSSTTCVRRPCWSPAASRLGAPLTFDVASSRPGRGDTLESPHARPGFAAAALDELFEGALDRGGDRRAARPAAPRPARPASAADSAGRLLLGVEHELRRRAAPRRGRRPR